MDIAILSPIAVEYHAVRQYLQTITEQVKEGVIYETGIYQGLHSHYNIVIRQTGSKNTDVALATDRIIRCFQPGVVLLVGVAGGVKDVAVGDIVVGIKAYGYESGKAIDDYLATRPESIPYDAELVEHARALVRQPRWQQLTAGWQPPAQVVFGPIASGDKVIASTSSPEYLLLKRHYNDTVALEMESIGFAKAALAHRQVRILNIRGISDLLDHKALADAQGGQELAAARAAAFTFALLDKIDFKTFNNHATPNASATSTPDLLLEIRNWIGKNKIKAALAALIDYTKGRDADLHDQVFQLSQQWHKVQKEEMLGIIAAADAGLAHHKIVYGLLLIVNQLEQAE